jgi:hypothetical protein
MLPCASPQKYELTAQDKLENVSHVNHNDFFDAVQQFFRVCLRGELMMQYLRISWAVGLCGSSLLATVVAFTACMRVAGPLIAFDNFWVILMVALIIVMVALLVLAQCHVDMAFVPAISDSTSTTPIDLSKLGREISTAGASSAGPSAVVGLATQGGQGSGTSPAPLTSVTVQQAAGAAVPSLMTFGSV